MNDFISIFPLVGTVFVYIEDGRVYARDDAGHIWWLDA